MSDSNRDSAHVIHIYMPTALYQRLSDIAWDKDVTLNSVVVGALAAYADREEARAKPRRAPRTPLR